MVAPDDTTGERTTDLMSKVNIPIAKGGKAAILSVDPSFFSDLPEEVQLEIIGAGLEKFLNAGMSSSEKFPAPTKLEGEALDNAKTAALAKAEANLEELKTGKSHTGQERQLAVQSHGRSYHV